MSSCYECSYSSDKCKNKQSREYDKYLEDIKECNLFGKLDNSVIKKYKLEELNKNENNN